MYCWRNETLRGENKQQQRNEMHFTIIQAETCDKVKIIIIFNNILFFILPVPTWKKSFIVVGWKQKRVVGSIFRKLTFFSIN
jgi:hypothetical protein